MWLLKISRDISTAEVPPEEWGVPAKGPVTGKKKVPVTFSCKSHWRLWLSETEASGALGVPLQGPTDGDTCWWTHQHWPPVLGQQLERHQGYKGRKWTVWLQGKGRTGSFQETKGMAGAIVPLMSPPPTPACRHQIWVSINLAHTVCSTLGIPWAETPTSLRHTQATTTGFSIQRACLGSFHLTKFTFCLNMFSCKGFCLGLNSLSNSSRHTQNCTIWFEGLIFNVVYVDLVSQETKDLHQLGICLMAANYSSKCLIQKVAA